MMYCGMTKQQYENRFCLLPKLRGISECTTAWGVVRVIRYRWLKRFQKQQPDDNEYRDKR